MKRSLAFILTIVIIFSFIGCGKLQQSTPESTPPFAETTLPLQTGEATQPMVPSATMQQKPIFSVSVPMITKVFSAEDGTDIFTYSYQSMNLTLQEPEVADKVIIDFLNRVDTANVTAEQMHASAEAAYTASGSWIPYMCRLLYEPTRIDQGVLSLFGNLSTYSGGVHPDHINVSASYDLLTGDVLTLGSIMHKDATMQMFCDLVIQELKSKENELYLFDDYIQAVTKRFAVEESEDENFYFTQTGLCFYFSPYEIAPYSSGTIVAEISYEKLVGILHDSYFPTERVFTNGTMQAVPFQDANMDEIFQISEAILTPGAQMYILTATNALDNIRMTLSSSDPQIHEYVFFAASSIAPGDAIMIEASEEELSQIIVSYENSAGVQTFLPAG